MKVLRSKEKAVTQVESIYKELKLNENDKIDYTCRFIIISNLLLF